MDRIVHTRLSEKDTKTIDQLVRAGAVSSRSSFIRTATKMLLSQYTGEPDINDIAKRLREVESNLNALRAKLEGTPHGF